MIGWVRVLGGWHGAAGTAYGSAWELWHHGAREVELGLSMLSQLVDQAGGAYQRTETGSAQLSGWCVVAEAFSN